MDRYPRVQRASRKVAARGIVGGPGRQVIGSSAGRELQHRQSVEVIAGLRSKPALVTHAYARAGV